MKGSFLLCLMTTVALTSFASGCKRDPCASDLFEGDDANQDGTELDPFTDSPSTNKLYEMTLDRPDDVDQFHFNVVDQGSDGNPELEIYVRPDGNEQLVLEVDYKCTEDAMVEFNCNGETIESTRDPVRGRVCRIANQGEIYMDITYDCEGVVDNTDSGFAVVTITRLNAPEACAAYDLEINTD